MRRGRGLGAANIRAFSLWNLRRLDWALLGLVFVLAFIGFAVLYSANRSVSVSTPYYAKQATFFVFGCFVALLIACLDYRFIVSLGPMIYVVFLGLLSAVLAVGHVAKGGRRWLDLGIVGFQPSEYTKLAVIIMLAWYFAKIGRRIQRFPYFVLTFVIIAAPGALIFKQPDLGTALTLGPIAVAMLYAAGCRTRHLIICALLGAAAVPVAWGHLEDYQRERVMTIINPSADPQGSGYHTIQSMITVGSGGLNGKGYMQGTQTYLSYLPEHHTDFIFSLLAEEFGFVGSCIVLALFLVLLLRGLQIARGASEAGGTLLGTGVVTLLSFHVFVNIAITIGLLPVTGIPLPFLSYGGSFYLTTMTSIGLLLSVNARKGLFEFSARPPALVPVR